VSILLLASTPEDPTVQAWISDTHIFKELRAWVWGEPNDFRLSWYVCLNSKFDDETYNLSLFFWYFFNYPLSCVSLSLFSLCEDFFFAAS
jgi:hypothetical protein